MKKFVSLAAVAVLGLSLVGCGTGVEVPPAHVGKILTKNGYAPDTIQPSKFRLEPCSRYCDKLVLLEASDTPLNEGALKIFMPKDTLNVTVDIRGTFSVLPSDALFDRVPADALNNTVSKIDSQKVYKTYGQQAVRGVVRSEITKYTIAQLMSEREAISQNIHAAIQKKLQATNTPVVISRFELADVQPPQVIVQAQEAAKEREIDIQKAEASAQVQMVEMQKDLELAKLERLVEREKAEALAEQNRIAASSLSPTLLEYRKVEAQEKIFLALAKNGNTMIVPANATGDFAENTVLAKQLASALKSK